MNSTPGHEAEADGCQIDDFKRNVFPVAYLLIFILGIVGHGVSAWVFISLWLRKRSLTTVNCFLVNLLVSDLMQVCSIPFRAAYFLLGSHWPFGEAACRLISFVFYLNMYGSIYFLVALNIMRYLALAQPNVFLRLQKCCQARVVCVLIWSFMALMSSPLLMVGDKTWSTKCLELNLQNVARLAVINHTTLVFGFALPLAIIVWCSASVVRNLLRRRPGLGKTHSSRKRACALVIISLCFFLLCFLPYHVLRTVFLEIEKSNVSIDSCHSRKTIRKAAVLTLCLGTANSCLDPILFFFVGEDFRTFFTKRFGVLRTATSNRHNSPQRVELKAQPNEHDCVQ